MMGMRLKINRIAIITLNSLILCLVLKIRAIAVPNRHQDVVAPIVVNTKIVIKMPISDISDPASLVYADTVLMITETPLGLTA